MSYIIEGILEINKVNEYDIIQTIDICNHIYLNICNNVNNIHCNITNKNENYINCNLENFIENKNVNNNINKNENNDTIFEKYLNLDNIEKYNQNNFGNNSNYNNQHKEIELLSLSIKINDKTIKKIPNKNTCIYIINFTYTININLCINTKLEEIKFKDMYSKSLNYKDININELDIYPINLDLKNLENKISFGLNCIVIDKSEELILENSIEPKEQIRENINKKDYSYIDINQEFI